MQRHHVGRLQGPRSLFDTSSGLSDEETWAPPSGPQFPQPPHRSWGVNYHHRPALPALHLALSTRGPGLPPALFDRGADCG